MRVTKIKLENYRSIRDNEANLDDFTIVIGKNNVGKSNLSNALSDYRRLVTNDVSPDQFHESAVTNRNSRLGILIEIGIEFSKEEVQEALNKHNSVDPVDDRFRRSVEDRGWFSYFKHRMVVSRNGIQENIVEADYKGQFYTVGEKSASNQIKLFSLPSLTDRPRSRNAQNRDPDLAIDVFPPGYREVVEKNCQRWDQISAFRRPDDYRPVRYDDRLESNGSNLSTVLNTISQKDKQKFQKIVDSYIDIMDGVNDLSAPLTPNGSDDRGSTTVEVDEHDVNGLPLTEISSGSKEILVLITKIILAEDISSLLLVEEPELHLHRSAEVKMFELLRESSEQGDIQVIISTHSDTFVDNIGVESIVSAKRADYTTFSSVESKQLNDQLAIRGYKKSNFIQSDSVLFVEGRSDKVIIEQFAETLGKPFDEHSITVRVIDGDPEKDKIEPVIQTLRQIGIPYLFVFDSDGKDPEEKQFDMADTLGISPIDVYVLERYSIESYLTTSESIRPISHVIGETQKSITNFLDGKTGSGNQKGVLQDLYLEFVGTKYNVEKNGVILARNHKKNEIDDEIEDLVEKIVDL